MHRAHIGNKDLPGSGDPGLEGGDGLRFVPRPDGQPGEVEMPNESKMGGKPSSSPMSVAGSDPSGGSSAPGYAVGIDSSGTPTLVEFGILSRYVASYYPLPSDTVDDVLRALAADLDANGLPAPTIRASGC